MTQPYSSFKLTYNYAFESDSAQPKFVDRNAVILDGATPVAFEVAVFVNASPAEDPAVRRPDYRLKLTPKSQTLRAAQADYMNGSLPTPRPGNAPADYDERRRAGYGSLWIVPRDEQEAARARGDEHVRTHSGNAVVLLPSGTIVAIDPVLFGRFTSDNKERKIFDFHSGALNPHDPEAAATARAARQAEPNEHIAAKARTGAKARVIRGSSATHDAGND